MWYFAVALVLAFCSANIALNRGRSEVLWFFGTLLCPLLILILLCSDDLTIRVCPYCSEDIKKTAIVCKHCHKEVSPPSTTKKKWKISWLSVAFFVALAFMLVTVWLVART